jgi:predicted dehydrogenase/uncharacterized membrane protein YbhN (UPF0104 family)
MAVKLRGAVLGAGNIALRGHAPQWTGDERLAREVDIVAVADLSEANREAARSAFPSARLYDDAEHLLEQETLDFCDICTPPFTHKPLVQAAAARGLHVLCEKPMAPSLAEAEAMATLVRASRIVFVPCHQYHHSPQWQAVVNQLPRLGRIYLAQYDVLRTEANPGNPNWSPAWRTDPAKSGGGILFDHGAHIFYQLRSVLGEPAVVQANVRTLRHSDYGVEDSAFVMLDFGDCLAEVRLTWAARHRAIRFLFVGEEGELQGDDTHLLIRGAITDEIRFDDGMSKNSSHSEWYAPLFQGFVDRVRSNDLSTGPLDEALYVARVIERAYESSTLKRSIALPRAHPSALSWARASAHAVVMKVVGGPVPQGAEVPPAEREEEAIRRTPWWVRAGGLVLLVASGAWALHDVSWSGLGDAIGETHLSWILAAALVNLGAVYAMAGRWRALLVPLSPLVSWTDAFGAMVMGFAVSSVIPARAGELARVEWLSRRCGMSRLPILSTIVLDHLVNGVGLFAGVLVLVMTLELPSWLRGTVTVGAIVLVCAVGLVLLVGPVRRPSGQAQGAGGALPGLGRALGQLRQGLAAVRDVGSIARSFGLSLVAWALEFLVLVCVQVAFGVHVPLGATLLVLVAVNLALILPFAPPANFGVLELGATLALMEFGIPKHQAVAFALVYHLLQLIPIGVLGLAACGESPK